MTDSNASRGPILIVDDDRAIADFIQMALEDEGYPCVVASDGEEAIRRIQDARPGLVLLDITMPILDGRAVFSWLRWNGHVHLPVVIMTAGGNAARLSRELGANDFLAKPFELDRLLACVRHWMKARRPAGGEDCPPSAGTS